MSDLTDAQTDESTALYSLADLADAAGVSIRTIRYYIAEGLLPPPIGGGAHSQYTQAHADRLALIAQLKAAYLPLREIRAQITGLQDAEISALLTEPIDEPTPAPRLMESAADYLRDLLPPPARASPPPAIARSRMQAPDQPAPVVPKDLRKVLRRAAIFSQPSESNQPEPSPWRRVSLTPEIELHIREDTYQAQTDKIAGFIDWARKVLE